MARFSGSFSALDVLNLNDRAFTDLVDNTHRELQGKFGPGIIHTERQPDGSVAYHYDYADKFGGAPEGSHLNRDQSRMFTPAQADAVKRAASNLRNKGSIKQVDDGAGGKKYVPIDDADEGAAQICQDVNILDQMVAMSEGGQGGLRDSNSPRQLAPPTQVSGAGLTEDHEGDTANDQMHQRDEAMGTEEVGHDLDNNDHDS